MTGLSVPRSVVEELRPGGDSVTVQSVKVVVMVMPLNRVRIATQRNVVNGFPGSSGQSAADTVVAEQEAGLDIVKRESFVKEQAMCRNCVTLRTAKVL